MELLSEQAEIMLDYLIEKSYCGDYIISASGFLPKEIDRDKALHELLDKGFCSDITKMGVNGFKCRFKNYKADEYKEMKPKLLKEKARMMFNKLSTCYEKYLSDLLIYKDNLAGYVDSLYKDADDERKTELNQIFGVLRENRLISCSYADNRAYYIEILFAGKHYFEFKEEALEEEQKKINANVINNYNAPVSSISGGKNQFNTANGNGTVNATQNNGINTDELKKLLDAIKVEIPDNISKDDKETVNDSLDIISSELLSDSPNEKNVKSQFKLLRKIDCGVKFASACCSLLTFANNMYPFLNDVVPFYQNLIS